MFLLSPIGGYDCVGFVMEFQRRYHYFLWQVYLPSGILVAISWLSFWIDVNAVPGRVALAITTLLTLETQFSSIQASLPPVSYLKAIDIWMFACMVSIYRELITRNIFFLWWVGRFNWILCIYGSDLDRLGK